MNYDNITRFHRVIRMNNVFFGKIIIRLSKFYGVYHIVNIKILIFFNRTCSIQCVLCLTLSVSYTPRSQFLYMKLMEI